ncbi:MAG: ATP-binding protein [Deltaproteobacteria bacterium]|nr:ATP-binding protein [Deltaproteobacteria bacterium]
MSSYRYLSHYLQTHPQDLAKMVLVAGPRQVGKTTLVKRLPKLLGYRHSCYLNWDIPEDRKILKSPDLHFFRELAANQSTPTLILLDEIHKNPRWKKFLKGLYDALHEQLHIVVTGSARLDTYRRGGDSLMGRYWLFHLFPLTIAEVNKNSQFKLPNPINHQVKKENYQVYHQLFQQGGFPEPLFKLNATQHARWSHLRKETLVKEDLRDLSRIQELEGIHTLMELLPNKVGSPLSLQSLLEDLEISHPTLKNWLRWLRHLYYYFSIPVYSKKLIRSLKKEQKIYLYDWANINDPGVRFENLVALHLYKAVTVYREMLGAPLELYYLRDKEKREVDFLVLKAKTPWLMIESKLNNESNPKQLKYYSERLKPEHAILLYHQSTKPEWKYYHNMKYWQTDAATFFAQWL